jgi:hypothetical protein
MSSCCIHLTPAVVTAASDLTKRLLEMRNGAGPYICCQCGILGDVRYGSFRDHHDTTGHFLCIRLHSPIEMYCFLCKDFQFSEEFDTALGRQRPKRIKRERVVATVHAPVPRFSTRKGLGNMGSTCFMGSILQVLIQMPPLVTCRQMQFSVDNCGLLLENMASIMSSKQSLSKPPRTVESDSKSNGKPRIISAGCIACEFQKLIEETIGR